MTQAELGERVGGTLGRTWSRQAVSTAEKGGRSFTAVELFVLAFELQVSIGSLFLPVPGDADEQIELPNGKVITAQTLIGFAADSGEWLRLQNGETFESIEAERQSKRQESESTRTEIVRLIEEMFTRWQTSHGDYEQSVARMEKNHHELEEATRAIIAEYRQANTFAQVVEDRLIARLAERAARIDSPEAKAFEKLLLDFQADESNERAATELPSDEEE